MRQKNAIFSDLPLEVGKKYKTKFANGEHFTVTKLEHYAKDGSKIAYPTAYGVYEKSPHLGECRLNEERIIHDKKFEKEIEICSKCKEPLD